MKTLLGVIAAIFGVLGMIASAVGIRFCWAFGLIGFGYNLYIGTAVLASLGLGVCWLLTALIAGGVGFVLSFLATAISMSCVEGSLK